MKNSSRLVNDESGIGLVEELVAVAILGILVVSLIGAFSTGSLAARTTSLQVTARNVAVAQMEYTKNQAYQTPPATYPTITPPGNWSVSAAASTIAGRDSSVEKLTVTVSLEGTSYLTLEGYKVDR
ncbi:MAG: type II secretion system protein [Chloroflexota bacterium]